MKKMKKIKFLIVLVVLTLATMAIFTGCSSYSQNELQYYFSDNSQELVEYNDDDDNIDTAGYYYYFTSGINATITIDINIQLNGFQAFYCYLNGEQVQSDSPDAAYTHKYADLTLAKGDEITFHAFAVNSFYAFESEPTLQYFVIDSYVISELSSLST